MQNYSIRTPDENGDGTLPQSSGIALPSHVKSFLKVTAAHEPAYREGVDVLRVRRFTLRAIVKVAQEVQATSLRYE